MARHPDPGTPSTRADRVLLGLIILAGGTFMLTVVWLLLGSR